MSELEEALIVLRWGADQDQWSASLTPQECQAVLLKLGDEPFLRAFGYLPTGEDVSDRVVIAQVPCVLTSPEPTEAGVPTEAPRAARGINDWTHPAEDCDTDGCDHITRRTCEAAEKTIAFMKRRIKRMRERLYKADPKAAEEDWNRIMAALNTEK